jgi:hypothetical protein
MKYPFSLTSLFTLILLISACSGSSPDQNGASSEQKIKGKSVSDLETATDYFIQEFEKTISLSEEQKNQIREYVMSSGYDVPDKKAEKKALFLKGRNYIFENFLSPEQQEAVRKKQKNG